MWLKLAAVRAGYSEIAVCIQLLAVVAARKHKAQESGDRG